MEFPRHPFEVLRSVLGPPVRTFTYAGSGVPSCDDHVWRCGCAAREQGGLCDLTPCASHAELNRTAFLHALWKARG